MRGSLVFVLCNCIALAVSHVNLIFPKPRDLALDFLDNGRTLAPCGMPKDVAKTSLVAGSSFNVTWHLGYPHRGGFKLELLDAADKFMQSLTPEDGGSKGDGWMDQDTTAQQHLVKLPSVTCKGCTVILLAEYFLTGR